MRRGGDDAKIIKKEQGDVIDISDERHTFFEAYLPLREYPFIKPNAYVRGEEQSLKVHGPVQLATRQWLLRRGLFDRHLELLVGLYTVFPHANFEI